MLSVLMLHTFCVEMTCD